MVQDPGLRLLSTSTIVPATPTEAGHMYLSSIDIMWQDIHYNRRVLFYNQAGPSAVEDLRRSLAEVLVAYYPWAGRLALDESKRLVIDCNDAGVEFVEASIDVAISEWGERGFQMSPAYEMLCRSVDHKGENLYTSPLLSVQATRFRDGGLAVAVAISHVVADGLSLWNFMVGWGEIARGEKLSTEPVHERWRLALENPSEEKAAVNLQAPQEDEEEEEEPAAAVSWAEAAADKPQEDPLVQCLFILPQSAVTKLKAQAGGAFSSYVVTSAHFWQRVAAAAAAPPSERTFFATLANLRNRLSPPLTPSYFGNALRFSVTRTAIRNVTCEGLAVTAQRVNAAVAASLDVEALLAFMHWLELHDNKVLDRLGLSGVALHVASSPRFPFYEVDFGWGPPAAVRSARVHGNGEMVFFGTRPGLGAGDVEICMPLPSSTMHRLLQDKDFLAYPPASPFQ